MKYRRASCFLGAAALSLVVTCGKGGGGAQSYFPTSVGSSWTYAVTSSTTSSTETISITQASGTSVTRKVLNGGSTTYQLQTLDVGAGVVQTASASYYVSNDLLVTGSSLAFSPPSLLMPSDLSAGAKASSTSTVTGGPATYTQTRDITVNGVESVTVPAGTFSALKVTTLVTSTLTPSAPGTYNVRWHAPGVGVVQIMNYPATNPSATTTFALTSYSISAPGGADGGPNAATQKWNLNMFGNAYVTLPPFTNSGAFSETSDSPGWYLTDMLGQNRVRIPLSGMVSHTASGDHWSFTITVANNGLTWTADGSGTANGNFPNATLVNGTVTGVLCQPPSAGGVCSNETHYFMGNRM